MNITTPTLSTVSRRDFLQTGAAAGGALMVGFVLPGCATPAASPVTTAMPNAWVRVGSDNSVTVLCARSEMGQGVYTSLPTLVAEELEVDLAKVAVKVDMAPAGEAYINTMVGGQLTGGSTSVKEAYTRLRVAGAQARSVLVQAAADKWKVDAAACRAQDAWVIGPAGQRASYGELAEAASKLTPPKEPKLKAAKDFRYVGKRMNRLDTPAKCDGTAEFGIDAKVPGMLVAALAQSPVFGGKVASFDAAKARAMPGVKHVVQISSGVAVVADTYWQAKQALAAVDIKWDAGAFASGSSAAIAAQLRQAVDKPDAPSFKKVGDADAALRGAARKVEAAYDLPYTAHVTMEPMNFIADVRADSCVLTGPTQFQQLAQGMVAGLLKLKPEQVTVRTTFLGGGFGRRVEVDFVVQAAEISKAVGRPVKLIWSREDDMTHDVYRPAAHIKLSAGLDAAGKPVAFKYAHAGASVTKRMFPAFVKDGVDPFMLEAAPIPYDIPNQLGYGVDPGQPGAHRLLALGVARPERVRQRIVHRRDGRGRRQGSAGVPAQPAGQGAEVPARAQHGGREVGLGQAAGGRAQARCRGDGRLRHVSRASGRGLGDRQRHQTAPHGGGGRRRHDGQSEHRRAADRVERDLRHGRGDVRRDHGQGWPRRADQLPQLPRAAHERSAEDRDPPHRRWRHSPAASASR